MSVQTGHAAQVVALAFSSDGRILASGSVDNTVKLWDPASGNELRALKGHDMSVMSVAFSPDDKMIASGSSDNTVKLWDVATGAEKKTLRGHTLYIRSVAFSPDGKLLASGSADQKVKIWDVSTGTEVRSLLPNIDPNYSLGIRVAFSRDGKTLISSGEVIKLWDVDSGALSRTIRVDDVGRIPDLPIAVSADGRTFATGGKSIKLWELATGKLLNSIPSGADAISFSSDGQTLAATNLTQLTVWNVTSGKELQTWEGVRQGVDSIAFDPDGKILASGNSDNTVRLWDPVKGEELRVLKGYADRVLTSALSGNGKVLASGIFGRVGRYDTVRIWDPTAGQLLRPLVGIGFVTHSLDLSNDGSSVVATGGGSSSFGMWHLSQSEEMKKFKFPQSGPNGFIPAQVALSADGGFVAAGGRNGVVKLLEVDSGREILSTSAHKNDVRGIAFSPKGDVFASSGSHQDMTVKIWSTTGQLLKTLKGHAGGITALML